MELIKLAAEVASLTLAQHYQRTWIRIDMQRLSRPQSSVSLKSNVDTLFKDTEEVIDHIWKQMA